MDYPSTMNSQQLRKKVWQTTFGDLLTLVLCLFLVLICSSPVIKPREQETNSTTWRAAAQIAEEQISNPPPGTAVAKQIEEAPWAAVVLNENDFSLDALEVRPEIAQRLKTQVSPESYRAGRAVISICDEGVVDGSWPTLTRRAMTVRRQLIDDGMTAERVALRLYGNECAPLNQGDNVTGGIGVIEFTPAPQEQG